MSVMTMVTTLVAYVAGPMSGYVNKNFGSFYHASFVLAFMGIDGDKLNPANKESENTGASWEEFMMMDAKLVRSADIVVLLENWERSKGACMEVKMATVWGIPVFELKGSTLVRVPDAYARSIGMYN